MELIIGANGNGTCVYGEELDLAALGELQIRRASHVEPDESGRWWADLSPVGGPRLRPFNQRSAAMTWLHLHLEHLSR
jgi:hypothetical protein